MKLSPSAEKECSGFFSETERLRYAGNARQRFREVFPAVFLAPLLTDLAPLFTLDFTAEAAFFTLPFTAFISERAFLSARLISFLTSTVSGVFFSADFTSPFFPSSSSSPPPSSSSLSSSPSSSSSSSSSSPSPSSPSPSTPPFQPFLSS
ncbi:MAG TPA: hypothetical protein DFL85_01995 [Lentisphaeria bacterium]|nr:hypothetical protein [Lentisphaeria bacterium]HCH84265.1 hypothetical protein [Lentisphaeria bacterium]